MDEGEGEGASVADSEAGVQDVSKASSTHETVNFDTTETETTADTNEEVIKLDTNVENAFQDEDEAPVNLQTVDDDEYGVLNIGDGGDEGEGREGEEAAGEGEVTGEPEAAVEKKVSIDLTDDIAMQQYSDPDTTAGEIRKLLESEEQLGVENIFGKYKPKAGQVAISQISSISEVEEEESEDISILAELGLQLKDKEPIDREAYTEQYQKLKDEERFLKRKNGLLHKKIGEYYIRRKITKVFDDVNSDMYEQLLERYEEKINDFCEITAHTQREREAVDNEMIDMVNLRDERMELLKKNFQAMQDREYDIGHTLIDTKTGKVISAKAIEKLLQRQQQKSEDISVIRLVYIKKRDRVREIEQKIKSLETIGGTLHLIDFEQLRMENQNFTDKVEEREDELMKLRNRYFRDMLGLAHIREKVNRVEVEIADMNTAKDFETENVAKKREQLNSLKLKRDSNRSAFDQLKKNTGILTNTMLLDEMSRSVKTADILRAYLKELKEKCKEDQKKLVNVKSHLIAAEKKLMKQEYAGFSRHTRPTVTYNVLPRIAHIKTKLKRLSNQIQM